MGLAFGIALFGIPRPGCSAVIPTPAPGAASPVTAPSPNPVQYNFSPGGTIFSANVNSNYYKSYNDLNTVISALNGCGYVPGPAISSVTATSPISASLGSCTPGSGTSLTLSFSAVGQGLTFGSVTSQGTITSQAADGASVLTYPANNNTLFASIGANTGSGYPYGGWAELNADKSFHAWLMGFDGSGNAHFNNVYSSTFQGNLNGNVSGNVSGSLSGGSVAATSFNATSSVTKNVGGTNYGIPFNADETSGSSNNHIEHGDLSVGSASVGANGCLGPYNITFNRAFDAVPTVIFSTDSYDRGGFAVATATSVTTSAAVAKLCNSSASSVTTPDYISWIAIGE